MRTRSVVAAAAATGVLLTAREYTAGGKSVSSMGCFYGLLGKLSPIRSSDLCTVVSNSCYCFLCTRSLPWRKAQSTCSACLCWCLTNALCCCSCRVCLFSGARPSLRRSSSSSVSLWRTQQLRQVRYGTLQQHPSYLLQDSCSLVTALTRTACDHAV
jgi:hypothetical protein